MNDNDEITTPTEPEEDSPEALLEEYDNKRLAELMTLRQCSL